MFGISVRVKDSIAAAELYCKAFGLELGYHVLKDGGQVTLDICELPWSPCAAQVTDRFGINWYLSLPGYRPPEDFRPEDC